jgi:hypothetical protein
VIERSGQNIVLDLIEFFFLNKSRERKRKYSRQKKSSRTRNLCVGTHHSPPPRAMSSSGESVLSRQMACAVFANSNALYPPSARDVQMLSKFFRTPVTTDAGMCVFLWRRSACSDFHVRLGVCCPSRHLRHLSPLPHGSSHSVSSCSLSDVRAGARLDAGVYCETSYWLLASLSLSRTLSPCERVYSLLEAGRTTLRASLASGGVAALRAHPQAAAGAASALSCGIRTSAAHAPSTAGDRAGR